MTVRFAHCLFEQSGTFKGEFIKLGVPAWDYDMEDRFKQTDWQCDLFCQIELAYRGMPSVFDNISPDYARNFICDYILGIDSGHTQPLLFND